MPTSERPNLRDHGQTLDRDAPRIIQSCQREHGYAHFTEAGYRAMHFEDTGHLPGVSTFPKWLDRAAAAGELHHMWLTRGGLMPDGSPCKVGVLLVRYATSREERGRFRAAYAQNAKRHGGRYRHERTDGGRQRETFAAMTCAERVVRRPPPAPAPRRRYTVAELEAALAATPKQAPS